MADNVFKKHPDATLDYYIDWANDGGNDGGSSDTGWLQGDTISSSVFTAESGITIDSQTNTTTVSKVVLSGGTPGVRYALKCVMSTAAGLTDIRRIWVDVTTEVEQ